MHVHSSLTDGYSFLCTNIDVLTFVSTPNLEHIHMSGKWSSTVNIQKQVKTNSSKWCFCVFQEGDGKWLSLDSELIMRNGEVIGTQTPTGHSVLVDARFELPYGKWNFIIFELFILNILDFLLLVFNNVWEVHAERKWQCQ